MPRTTPRSICLDDADRLQRCLDALTQVDANANLPTLIECWIDDMVPGVGTLARGDRL